METKKFKCKDEILLKSTIDKSAVWFYAVFSHYCKDNTYITLSGGITYNSAFYCLLPYEGNEHLVGTTDEPEEEVKLEEGEFIITTSRSDRINQCSGVLERFQEVGENYFIVNDGDRYLYAIPFKDFDPSNMEETRKHILGVKNGKIVKYRQ